MHGLVVAVVRKSCISYHCSWGPSEFCSRCRGPGSHYMLCHLGNISSTGLSPLSSSQDLGTLEANCHLMRFARWIEVSLVHIGQQTLEVWLQTCGYAGSPHPILYLGAKGQSRDVGNSEPINIVDDVTNLFPSM